MGRSVRSDLAAEVHAFLREGGAGEIPGVRWREEQRGAVTVTRVEILDRRGEAAMGKAPGTYVTLESSQLRRRDRQVQEAVARLLAEELAGLLRLASDALVLVVGLGNWNATPDALGPRVVGSILVTRHLGEFVPGEAAGRLRPVCAVAPGVLGLTGIETGEIVRGIVDRVRPAAVVAVDALASRSVARITTTIQLTDAGVRPGSGVGNHRSGIDRETLGVPVTALGVPTVVHAATIVEDALERLREGEDGPVRTALAGLDERESRRLLREVLPPAVGDLMVTPKEIDVLMDDLSRVVAGGINGALHPGMRGENLLRCWE